MANKKSSKAKMPRDWNMVALINRGGRPNTKNKKNPSRSKQKMDLKKSLEGKDYPPGSFCI